MWCCHGNYDWTLLSKWQTLCTSYTRSTDRPVSFMGTSRGGALCTRTHTPHTHSHPHSTHTHTLTPHTLTPWLWCSANILLDAYLVPKLSDFGLARELKRGPNERSTYSTKSDVVMGTMAYMAPEFIRNKKFTPRTDVYSYGVVLLEMYTGQPALSSDHTHKNRVLVSVGVWGCEGCDDLFITIDGSFVTVDCWLGGSTWGGGEGGGSPGQLAPPDRTGTVWHCYCVPATHTQASARHGSGQPDTHCSVWILHGLIVSALLLVVA